MLLIIYTYDFLPPNAFTINTTIITTTIILSQIPTLKPAPKISEIAWQLLSAVTHKNNIVDNKNEKCFMLFNFRCD